MKPREFGGWGIKHMLLFSKALAAKGGWKIIAIRGLWQNILYHKYIFPSTSGEWVRTPNKISRRKSNFWNTISDSLSIIDHHLCGKIGDGKSARLQVYNWIRRDANYKMPRLPATNSIKWWWMFLWKVLLLPKLVFSLSFPSTTPYSIGVIFKDKIRKTPGAVPFVKKLGRQLHTF